MKVDRIHTAEPVRLPKPANKVSNVIDSAQFKDGMVTCELGVYLPDVRSIIPWANITIMHMSDTPAHEPEQPGEEPRETQAGPRRGRPPGTTKRKD